MRVLRSRLSLCSVTFICCRIISAEVNGLLDRAACGTVNPSRGLAGDGDADPDEVGDDGMGTAPQELVRRDDGDFFAIFSPNAFFTRLVTAIPTPWCFPGDPGIEP